MALSPDGKLLAAGDAEGRVEVWSLEKKGVPVSWKTGRLNISALAFGSNPRRAPGEMPWGLATGNQGGNIAIWDLADQSVRSLLQGSAHDVFALEFSHDGVLLASSGRSEPHIWNVATGKIILELPFHDYATSLAFSPQGDRLAIANFHSPFYGLEIQVVRLENGRGLMSFHGLSGQIEFVEFSKDGSLLAAGVRSQQELCGGESRRRCEFMHHRLPVLVNGQDRRLGVITTLAPFTVLEISREPNQAGTSGLGPTTRGC
jgi:hypothetical protein